MAEVLTPQQSQGVSRSTPVAPDTTIEAYIRAHPNVDPNKARRFLKKGGFYWAWEGNDLRGLQSDYDSWVTRQTNAYNAELADYANWYNSPNNTREMLEEAGYNVNYLQGASQSRMDSPGSIEPQLSEGPGVGDTMERIKGVYDTIMSAIGTIAKLDNVQASTANIQADTDLKKAQTRGVNVASFYDELSKAYQWYTDAFENGPGNLSVVPRHGGVSEFATPAATNIAPDYMRTRNALQLGRVRLVQAQTAFSELSKEQQEQLFPDIQGIMQLHEKLLDGSLTAQEFNNKILEKRQQLYEKYGEHEEVQRIILNYVDGITDIAGAVSNFLTPVKVAKIGHAPTTTTTMEYIYQKK